MKRRRPPPDAGLGKPKTKFEDTFSGEGPVLDWLKESGATYSDREGNNAYS